MRLFAQRTSWELSNNALMRSLSKLKSAGVPILDLTESNPTCCGFHFPQNELLEVLGDAGCMDYSPDPKGLLKAREAICSYYAKKNIDLNPEQLFLTSSTSEAYSYLFRLLADPQDTVFFPQPSYPLFQYLADLNDLLFKTYSLDEENDWRIQKDELNDRVDANTKIIVMVNPNNPTGNYVHQEDLIFVNEVCQRIGSSLICDEVFFDFPLSEDIHPKSLLSNEVCLTFVLGGLSKMLALPQMKLSWIYVNGPKAQVQDALARLEVIADTYLSVNTPVQQALNKWLTLAPKIQSEILSRIKGNYQYLESTFNNADDCFVNSPQGGWYTVIRLPDSIEEEGALIELLNKSHVFAHPGYFFDFSMQPVAIISLLPRNELFKMGVDRMKERILS